MFLRGNNFFRSGELENFVIDYGNRRMLVVVIFMWGICRFFVLFCLFCICLNFFIIKSMSFIIDWNYIYKVKLRKNYF